MRSDGTSKKTSEFYRAEFIRAGSSVSKWAKENGYSPVYIYDVLKGARNGEKAKDIKSRIEKKLEQELSAS